MKVSMLLNEERIGKKADLLVEFDHTDLTETTANTAQTLSPFTILGLYQGVELVQAEIKEAFEDTTDAAFNDVQITAGDAGSTARLLAAMQINRNGTEVYLKPGTGTTYVPTTDTIQTITVNAMAAKNLNALNRGKAALYYRLRDQRPQN